MRVPRPRPADPSAAFSDEEIHASLAYARPRQRWSLVAICIDLAVLAALALTRPGQDLLGALADLGRGHLAAGAVIVAATLTLARALIGFPFSLRTWCQDRRAGLSTQAFRPWLADWSKANAIGAALTVLPVAGLVVAARDLPGFPVSAALAGALLVTVLTLAGPVVFEPIFNRFRSMPDGPLRAQVLATAESMGLPVRDVLVADASRRTTRLNAYVSGLGRTRRVVVYDNLADRAAEDEVLIVLAHELAHVRHRDVAWGTAGTAAAVALAVLALDRLFALDGVRDAFGLSGLDDPTAPGAVLLVAVLGGLLVAPVSSAISRWAEARADWTALEVRRDPGSAVAIERRLALDNRANLRPNRLLVAWFSSHPPVMARIAQAWYWAEQQHERRPR